MDNLKLQIEIYDELKFPDPRWIIEQYKKLCDYIESVGGGGEGIEGVSSVLWSHRKWLYKVPYNATDEQLKEWLLHCFWLQEIMPREYTNMFRSDIGLRTLILLLCGVETFYLCDDCRAPLYEDSDPDVSDDNDDWCPWCGDCFNNQTDYKFIVVSKEQPIDSDSLRSNTSEEKVIKDA